MTLGRSYGSSCRAGLWACARGASHGELFSHREEGELELACVLRPQVGMGSLSGVPYVAALGACEGLEQLGVAGVGVGWPADVVREDGAGLVAHVRTSAGYAEGMFVVCSLSFDVAGGAHADALPADEQVAGAVCSAILARVDAWAAAVGAGRAVAGPLAPVLSDYFDRVTLMGKPVELVYPNGRVAMRGTLAGVDVWGRATMRNELASLAARSRSRPSRRPSARRSRGGVSPRRGLLAVASAAGGAISRGCHAA